jgi:RHS repeat-associated protein
VTEKYLWQGMTRLLAVYDGANILRQRFEYADERMPVAMKMGSATYYLNYDQVGSLRLVADASGNVVKRISYDSFGNILEDTNPSFTIPFGFAGGLHDRDTGLVRFGYRDYDPEAGRWTAKDPIGFASGDTDLYGYVLNNPVNFIDPYGYAAQIGSRKLDRRWVPFNGHWRFRHDQIWYEDGSNSGFLGDNVIGEDIGHEREDYDFTRNPKLYNDDWMREAETNVKNNWEMDWRLIKNDCQQYTDAARREYDRLEQERETKKCH